MGSGSPAVDTFISKGKICLEHVLVILETSLVWVVWMFMALWPESGSRWAGQHSLRRCLALRSILADIPYATIVAVAKRQTPLASAPELFAAYKGASAVTWDEIGFYAYMMHRHTRMGAQALLGCMGIGLVVFSGLGWVLLYLLAGALGLAGLGLLVLGAFLLK